jgi:thymidylate synthase ThyX
MEKFNLLEKKLLNYYFTSSLEEDTVYAARNTLPQEIVGCIIGKASRAQDTFREIFLKMWTDACDGETVYDSGVDGNQIVLEKISKHSINFLNKYRLHNSLRDVPHVAVFCDELSILLTKVWEHEPVAEYQEKSTRYRPFVASNVYLPYGISNGLHDRISDGNIKLIETYNAIFDETKKRDLARYLLPVGSKTAMASMASIRSWERIVGRMLAYPTIESEILGKKIMQHVRLALGSSSDTNPTFNYNSEYIDKCKKDFSFIGDIPVTRAATHSAEQEVTVKKIDGEDVYKLIGLIDIGAHRDLQRHRSVIQNIPDYRPIHGYDKLISQYISADLYSKYEECMRLFNDLFWDTYDELKGLNIGEIQYISLLGHMTSFWYVTDRERWQYIHDLRTGAPTQKATNPKTVHFSYSSWCKKAEEKIKKGESLDLIEGC